MSSWLYAGSSSSILEQQKLNHMSNINGSSFNNVGVQKKYTPSELKQLTFTKQNDVSPYSFGGLISQGQVSHSRTSLYASDRSKRKKKNSNRFPKEKKYQIYEQKSHNGWKSYYTYYVDGLRTDAFGRSANDVGFSGYGEQPIYSKAPEFIPLNVKKNKKFRDRGVSGLDASTNLEFEKMNTHMEYTKNVLDKIEKIKEEANTYLNDESIINTDGVFIGDVYSINKDDLFRTLYKKTFSVDITSANDFKTNDTTEVSINADGTTVKITTNDAGEQTRTIIGIDGTTTTTDISNTGDNIVSQEDNDQAISNENNSLNVMTQQLQNALELLLDYENQVSILEGDINTWKNKIKKEKKKSIPNIVKIASWTALIVAAEASIIALNSLISASNLIINKLNDDILEKQQLINTLNNIAAGINNNIVGKIQNSIINGETTNTDTGTTTTTSVGGVTTTIKVNTKKEQEDEKIKKRNAIRQNLSHKTRQNLTVQSIKILSDRGKSTHGLTNYIYYPPTLYNNRTPYNLYKPKGTFTNKNYKVL
jgi:hypothetical protein